MTKPSEFARALKTEEALYVEKLRDLNEKVKETTTALNKLSAQADQVASLIDYLRAAMAKVDKYEETFPEEEEPFAVVETSNASITIKASDYNYV